MKRQILFFAASFGIILIAGAQTIADKARRAVDTFKSSPALRHSATGVIIYDLEGDSTIAAWNPDLTVTTASTMKTVTSAAALDELGADFQFETPVLLDGELKGNKLHGNIIVRGTGDPTLGSQFFKDDCDLAAEVVEALKEFGIKQVEGRVIVDNTLYAYPAYHGDWCADDLAWNYGMGVHGVNYCDNRLKLSFRVHDGQLQDVTVKPAMRGLDVVNRLEKGCNDDNVNLLLEYARPAVVVAGSAMADTTYYFTIANPTPDVLLADSLERAINYAGIKVKNKHIAPLGDNGKPMTLVTHRSPALSDIIASLLERSDNMFAEALLRAVAVHCGLKGTDANGVEHLDKLLAQRGIDTSPKFQADGSGLARKNKATTRFFAHFLKAYANDRFGNDRLRLVDLMPRVGINAKIGSKINSSALTGNIAVKSGSMSHVQCYVGYFPAGEPKYAFAVLVNNWHGSRPSIKDLIDQLLIDAFE